MGKLPRNCIPLLVRLDFSDDGAWGRLCATISRLGAQPQAKIDLIDDPAHDRLKILELVQLTKAKDRCAVLYAADRTTMIHIDRPIIVVDLRGALLRTFRVIPSAFWTVQHSLSLSTIEFEEFVKSADDDGIFRGFG